MFETSQGAKWFRIQIVFQLYTLQLQVYASVLYISTSVWVLRTIYNKYKGSHANCEHGYYLKFDFNGGGCNTAGSSLYSLSIEISSSVAH